MRKAKGFTLIELLVVFTLLAMLLSIAVPKYLQSADSAKEKVRQQNLSTIRDALDKFNADKGRYPNELSELVEKKYLRALPLDPVSGGTDWVAIRETQGETPGVTDVAPPGSQEEQESPQGGPVQAGAQPGGPLPPLPIPTGVPGK